MVFHFYTTVCFFKGKKKVEFLKLRSGLSQHYSLVIPGIILRFLECDGLDRFEGPTVRTAVLHLQK